MISENEYVFNDMGRVGQCCRIKGAVIAFELVKLYYVFHSKFDTYILEKSECVC